MLTAALQNQIRPLRNVSSGRHAACTRHATQDLHPALDRHAQVVTDAMQSECSCWSKQISHKASSLNATVKIDNKGTQHVNNGISKPNTSAKKCQLWPPRRMH